jgi:hypothetical protein
MRTAYNLRAADDDWGQAGTLLRDVMDDAERERLVSNVAGHLRNGVTSRSWSVPSSTGKHRQTNRRENRSGRAQRIVLTDDPDRARRWRVRPPESAPGGRSASSGDLPIAATQMRCRRAPRGMVVTWSSRSPLGARPTPIVERSTARNGGSRLSECLIDQRPASVGSVGRQTIRER